MAGRASQVDQAAAITKVVQVAAFAPVFRQHVAEIAGYDIVCDGTDNFGTRFLVAWSDDSLIHLTRIDADDSLHSESEAVANFSFGSVRPIAMASNGEAHPFLRLDEIVAIASDRYLRERARKESPDLIRNGAAEREHHTSNSIRSVFVRRS